LDIGDVFTKSNNNNDNKMNAANNNNMPLPLLLALTQGLVQIESSN
jgi:hypothetical protein